jgi:hypothetical protein
MNLTLTLTTKSLFLSFCWPLFGGKDFEFFLFLLPLNVFIRSPNSRSVYLDGLDNIVGVVLGLLDLDEDVAFAVVLAQNGVCKVATALFQKLAIV